MTWGQIRLQLVKYRTSIDPELISGWMEARYQAILGFHAWKRLEVESYLQTVAAYLTGTVNVAAGSTAITTTGTWAAGFAGRKIRVGGRVEWYTLAFTAPATWTLDRPFEGGTDPAAAYSMFENVYDLPADLDTLEGLYSPVTGLPLEQWTLHQLRQAVGRSGWLGTPAAFAQTGDGEVELWPVPELPVGVPIRYTKLVVGFTGSNTSASPLDWVNPTAIVEGVRADMLSHLEDYSGADRREAAFGAALAAMVGKEALNKPGRALKMAPRYTRQCSSGSSTRNFNLP